MKSRLKSRRGFIDLVLAVILALGSLFLPAVQGSKSYNRTAAPGTTIIANP